MIRMTCDRCGKVMDTNSIHETPGIRVVVPSITTGKLREVDLCPECEEKLLLYIFGEEGPNDQQPDDCRSDS